MGEFGKAVTDILAALLPDNDVGKVLMLLIVVFLVFVITGRFKLEWIGVGVRHVYRWLRCKIWGRHRYFPNGIGWYYFNTGRHTGTFVCDVCGKVRAVK